PLQATVREIRAGHDRLTGVRQRLLLLRLRPLRLVVRAAPGVARLLRLRAERRLLTAGVVAAGRDRRNPGNGLSRAGSARRVPTAVDGASGRVASHLAPPSLRRLIERLKVVDLVRRQA